MSNLRSSWALAEVGDPGCASEQTLGLYLCTAAPKEKSWDTGIRDETSLDSWRQHRKVMRVRGGDSAPQTCPGQTPPGTFCSVLGSQHRKDMELQDDQSDGAALV